MKRAKNALGFTPLLQSYVEGQKGIPYRKELNLVTGWATASILLQQVIYWSSRSNPFYKFQAPCNHELYSLGDSWQEELGFSRSEFEKAIKCIGTRINKGDKKSEIAARDVPQSMILYWTDRNRVTWWELNVPLVTKMVEKCLQESARLSNAVTQHQISKGLTQHQVMMKQRIRLRSETNSETNSECVESSENLDEQPTHTPAAKDLNSDKGKEENETLEKTSSEEPESKVKNLTNPDKLENPKKESSAKERKVSAAENSTRPPEYAPKTAVNVFPDESAILNAWNGLKAQKWRAMAAGTIVGSSILGIQFFLNHANGDPSGAVTLFKKTLEVAAKDDYFKKMSLRPNQALDPNSSAFIGHFLGDALQVEKPAPVSPTPDPAHTTTEPIQPTFFFGGL